VADQATKELESRRVRQLVDLAQGGDKSALEELYLIHFDRIYGYLAVTVGNRHDAEDLTTKTFLKMIESIERFRWGSAPFSAWLFRIAHNAAIDHFRANRRWQPEEEVPEPPADASTSAEAGALAAIAEQSMLALIDDLSLDQKQVLTLKFVYRFSNAEAALVLGKSEGAIKSLQHRALASLQRKLRRRGELPGA
jgi:RNA polymerase sigma-70 factor (ECF subfamily)